MPHVILSGTPDLSVIHKQFEPVRTDLNGWIIKIHHSLLSEHNRTVVYDCTAVRSGFSQDFYIRAELKDGRVSVRVDPYMRIERNEGVQRIIVYIAGLLLKAYPELAVSKSNIPEEILNGLRHDGGN